MKEAAATGAPDAQVESHLASLLDSLEAEGAEKIEECYAYAKTYPHTQRALWTREEHIWEL